MNKHERAVALIGKELDWLKQGIYVGPHGHPPLIDALAYALRVLEAVEGVEAWMAAWMDGNNTLPQIITTNSSPDMWEDAANTRIACALQAILDARADPDA